MMKNGGGARVAPRGDDGSGKGGLKQAVVAVMAANEFRSRGVVGRRRRNLSDAALSRRKTNVHRTPPSSASSSSASRSSLPAAEDGTRLICDFHELRKRIVYEVLPPGLNVAAILLNEVLFEGRSLTSAWLFAVNCQYAFSAKHPMPPHGDFPVTVMFLINGLIPSLLWAGVILVWSSDEVREVIEPTEAAVWFVLYLVRGVTVSTKYSFTPKAFREAQYRADFTGEHHLSNMLGGGWTTPAEYATVLQAALFEAMVAADVHLDRLFVDLLGNGGRDEDSASAELVAQLRRVAPPSPWAIQQQQQQQGEQQPGGNGDDIKESEMCAAELLWIVLFRTIGRPVPPGRRPAMILLAFSILCTPLIGRACVGLPMMGASWLQKFCCSAMLIGGFSGVLTLTIFNSVGNMSFQRRAESLALMDRLCSDCVPLADLVSNHDPREKGGEQYRPTTAAAGLGLRQQQQHTLSSSVTIPLNRSSNVMAVTLMRRVVRRVGARWQKRVDVYSTFMYIVAIGLMSWIMLTFTVAQPEGHRFPTFLLVLALAVLVSTAVVCNVIVAARCNRSPQRHRKCLQREKLVACGRLNDLVAQQLLGGDDASGGGDLLSKEIMVVRAHLDLLAQADDICHYEEEVVDPTTVLSVAANLGTIKKTLGALALVAAFACEAFVRLVFTEGWRYRHGGFFSPPAPEGADD